MNKIKLTILLSLFCFSVALAQLNIEINDNMVIETSSNMLINNVSDVVENGTGYLKGVVESSSLSAATQFAGLQLTNGFTGTIKRTTGSSYAKGNGEGQNFKRYYEINNTSGSALTTDCTVQIVNSGSNDETLGMSGPYYLYGYSTAWQGYGDGSTGSTVSASNVNIPTGNSDLVISEGTTVSVKTFLEGPYDVNGDTMLTTINGDIPTTSPYSEDPRTASAVPSDAVDWVLVELRETASGTTLESRSAFINSGGSLIEDDGTTGVGLKVKPGDYYVIIKHRNHLGIMTANAVTGLTWGVTGTQYDFTSASSQFYGGSAGAANLEAGIWGMVAGDANGSGIVSNSDKDDVNTNNNSSGYLDSDTNMSGIVSNSDKDPVNNNLNKSTQIP